MNFFDTLGWWNLVWAVPLCVLFGVFLSAYWPFGKGPEGPPYVGFDSEVQEIPVEKARSQVDAYQRQLDQQRASRLKIYEPGDPPGTYGYRIGDAIHRQVEAYQAALLDEHSLFGYSNPHPGQHCSPECWRKPDGHRWAD